ncbi:MAG: hypothetical protein IBX68_05140 [Dehalococcoidia bacterium]|nr:hypothetical protein [Dehalococcoidia bacterium]
MTLKNAIASCLIIALGVILALHFALFWIYGGVFISESNKTVLLIETIMSLGILAFGIEYLFHSCSCKRRGKPPCDSPIISGWCRTGQTRRTSRPAARLPGPALFSSSAGRSENHSVSISRAEAGLSDVRISAAPSNSSRTQGCTSSMIDDGP